MATESPEFIPPQKTITVEFLVGVFSLVGLGCFAYLAVNIAGMKFFNRDTYTLQAQFNNISGLEIGAPVEIAGVPVGEVSNIDLDDTAALVTLTIRNGVTLREDDIASIRTKGIIGDRYIKITPGNSDAQIRVGQSITDTESAVDLEEIIGKLIHRMEK